MAATKKGSKPDIFAGLQKTGVKNLAPEVKAEDVKKAPEKEPEVKNNPEEEKVTVAEEVERKTPQAPEASVPVMNAPEEEIKVAEQIPEELPRPVATPIRPIPPESRAAQIVPPIQPQPAPKKRGRKAATPTGDTEEICRQTYYYTYEEMAAIKTVGFLEDRTHSEIVRELIDFALEQKYPGLLGRADVLKKAENLREKIKNRQSIDEA